MALADRIIIRHSSITAAVVLSKGIIVTEIGMLIAMTVEGHIESEGDLGVERMIVKEAVKEMFTGKESVIVIVIATEIAGDTITVMSKLKSRADTQSM